ncbi:MAG: hypothetical protein R3195_12395 [Gemmatimonadota bacterium]|nr:hypothetical protein [Gemmatimonadota bacterium]
MYRETRPAILAVVVIGTLAAPASGLQTGPGETPAIMNEREEIRLALSAAPPHVHANATVLVLGRDGFRVAREGANGFTCLVERAADPAVRAPQCLDAVATEYVLPVKLEEARLRISGASEETIDSRIAGGFADGRFRAPPRPAFNYMMSAGQYLGADAGQWNPHVMVYTPYLTNRELGGDPRKPEFPYVAFDEGEPLALTVIVTTTFVDPATVDPGR